MKTKLDSIQAFILCIALLEVICWRGRPIASFVSAFTVHSRRVTRQTGKCRFPVLFAKIPPGEKLMKEYEEENTSNSDGGNEESPGIIEEVPSSPGKAIDERGDDGSDSLLVSSTEKPESESKKEPEKEQTSTISLEFLEDVEEDIATTFEIEELKKNLQSPNPVVQIPARMKLSQIEQLQKIRTTQRDIENSINTVKEGVYTTADAIAKTPSRIKETVERTKKTTEDAIETIQSTPSRIQGKVDEIKQDIQNTKESVENTVENIKAIPSNVKKAADDTKQKVTDVVDTIQAIPSNVQKSIDETKQSVADAQKKAEDTITGVVEFGKGVVDTTQNVVKAGNDVVQKVGGLSAAGDKVDNTVDPPSVKVSKETSDVALSTAQPPLFFADSIEKEESSEIKKEVNDAVSLDDEVNAALELAMKAIEEADDVLSKKTD